MSAPERQSVGASIADDNVVITRTRRATTLYPENYLLYRHAVQHLFILP